MEGKKISFGFMKTKKAEKPVIQEKKEFIECVEEQSIKVIGGEVIQEKAPLIIPMKPNTLITAEKLKKIAEEVESAIQEPEIKAEPETLIKVEPIEENLSLDQLAVKELLEDAKKDIKVETQELTVPIPAQPILEGQKESTLDDYESVPIQDFGLAMLRGMGWQPGKEQNKYKEPQLRPKGLGLGADKVVKQNQTKTSGKDGDKELMIVKNAFVKITAGKHSGYYGKVVSLDEDNGRVMVDITMKKETVSLSEFMMQPVTKAEFDKQSRVINADKYEEYKSKEKEPQNTSSRHDSPRRERESTSRQERNEREGTSRHGDVRRDVIKRETKGTNEREGNSRSDDVSKKRWEEKYPERSRDLENSSNGKSRDKDSRRRDSSSEGRSNRRRKKDKKRYSSNDSLSSLSDSDKRRKRKETGKRRSSNSESDSSDEKHKKHKKTKKHRHRSESVEKRDIDKKRKGKKKKRDRDRSPNYKKHRK